MKILALDFDGVIADTSRETFTVSLRTWARLEPEAGLFRHPLAHLDGVPPSDEPFETDEFFGRFVATMPLGNRAEDFGVVLEALNRGVELRDQVAYDAFRATFSPAWLERFHRVYYEERDALRRRDPAGWEALQRPYPHMLELLRERVARGAAAVVTARDRGSLLQLLRAWGLTPVISAEMVYDKESGVRKTAHLRRLLEDTGVSPEMVTFVDDKVNHLVAAASLGVRGVLAGWGHNTSREHAEARRRGLPVAMVENAGDLLL